MKVIGLTGGIASGKSTISMLLKNRGAVIIDADEIAREIMTPGKPAWRAVIENFGRDILLDEKNIDRKKLGRIVFSDRKLLETLNGITHPTIVREIKDRLEHYRKENAKVVVVDAALLLETGLDSLVDEVWVVAVDEKTQLKRLLNREKNMSLEEAMNRIMAQMTLDKKIKMADKIIDNSGSIEETEQQIDELWREIEQSWQKKLQQH
ncbi:MAG TPA: dephospho-CoA kinase [Thermoanaerobacterales bacterium]|nr:dephospho-CoA kinase [Thermoanaerobacterales bacterium]